MLSLNIVSVHKVLAYLIRLFEFNKEQKIYSSFQRILTSKGILEKLYKFIILSYLIFKVNNYHLLIDLIANWTAILIFGRFLVLFPNLEDKVEAEYKVIYIMYSL